MDEYRHLIIDRKPVILSVDEIVTLTCATSAYGDLSRIYVASACGAYYVVACIRANSDSQVTRDLLTSDEMMEHARNDWTDVAFLGYNKVCVMKFADAEFTIPLDLKRNDAIFKSP